MSAQPCHLRIGLLMHSLNPRGGVVHTLELADALCERGHEVTVFAAARPGQTLFRTTQAHLSVAPLSPHEPGLVPMVAARRDALVAHLQSLPTLTDFDVLHSQDGITANALATLQDQGRIQGFVRTVHHLDDFLEPTLRGWQARGVHAASQVLCVSPSWQATLQHDWGIHAQVVHNGVNTRRFTRHASPEDAAMLQGLGVQGEGPVWLSVGGVEERKNTTRLLQAFAQVQAMRPAWQAPGQLVIAGGASLLDHDAYGQQFKAALAALPPDVQARVIVTGPLPDAALPALYRRATALAMPSLMEGFGLVALEALACGTLAIVSRISPFVDHFSPHEVLWADPASITSIAQALNDSLAQAKRQPIVQAAPGVCARFSWAQSAARHESIYRALRSLQVLPLSPRLPMPEMLFKVRWPDQQDSTCYSPSLIVQDYLTPGTSYPLDDFLQRVHEALEIASERVRAKYGFACSRAMDQWAEIDATAQRFKDLPGAQVRVIGFH